MGRTRSHSKLLTSLVVRNLTTSSCHRVPPSTSLPMLRMSSSSTAQIMLLFLSHAPGQTRHAALETRMRESSWMVSSFLRRPSPIQKIECIEISTANQNWRCTFEAADHHQLMYSNKSSLIVRQPE